MRKKQIISILLVLAVLFSGMTAALADTIGPAEEVQISARSLPMQMIQYENENLSWEDYGFSYFDDDGNLVVCVLENSKKSMIANKAASLNQKAASLANANGTNSLSGQPKVLTRMVKYSFQEIMDAKDLIFGAGIEGVSSVSASATQNKVVVGADPLTDTLKNAVYALVPTDIVSFEYEKQPEPLAGLNSPPAGGQIYPGTATGMVATYGYGSLGFPAKYNGKLGFVTALHVTWPSATDSSLYQYAYNAQGTMIGKNPVILKNTLSADNLDLVFYERVNPTFGMSLTTKNGQTLPTNILTQSTLNDLLEGDEEYRIREGIDVVKDGATTGVTQGKLLSVYASMRYNDFDFSNLIRTNAEARAGDSGCPAWSTSPRGLIGTASYSSNREIDPDNPSDQWDQWTHRTYFTSVGNITNFSVASYASAYSSAVFSFSSQTDAGRLYLALLYIGVDAEVEALANGTYRVRTTDKLSYTRANQIKTGVYKVKGYSGVIETVYY